MHNKLENKIREHAEEIFGSEPLEGHRDRFAGKLITAGNKKSISFRQIINYTAVAAIFAGCIFFLHRTFTPHSMQDEPLSEVQNYYSMLLQDQIDAIEQLLQRVDIEDRSSLMTDIETVQKEADFSMENSDEKNPEYIARIYSSKIEALQHIHNILADNLLTHNIN